MSKKKIKFDRFLNKPVTKKEIVYQQKDDQSLSKESKLSLNCTKIIEYLILATLILLPLTFLKNYPIELIKNSIFEFLVILMLVFQLIKIIETRQFFIKLNFITLSLISLIILGLISALLSNNLNIAFWGNSISFLGYKSLIFLIIFFVILIDNIKRKSFIFIIFNILIITSYLLSLVAITQKLDSGAFNLTLVPNLTFITGLGRIYATMGDSLFLSSYMAIVLPITFYMMGLIICEFKSRMYLAYFYAIAIILQIIVICLTGNYEIILAVILAILLTLIFVGLSNKNKKTFVTSIAISVILIVTLTLVLLPSDPLKLSNNNFVSKIIEIKNEKVIVWQSSLKMINNNLFFGLGPDNSESQSQLINNFDSKIYQLENSNYRINKAQNIILDNLLSYGIFWTVLFIGLIFYLLKYLVKIILDNNQDTGSKYYYLTLFSCMIIYMTSNLFSSPDINQLVLLFLFIALIYQQKLNICYQKDIEIKSQYYQAKSMNNKIYLVLLPIIILPIIYFIDAKQIVIYHNFIKANDILNQGKEIDKGEELYKKSILQVPKDYGKTMLMLNYKLGKISKVDDYNDLSIFIDKLIEKIPNELTYFTYKTMVYRNWALANSEKQVEFDNLIDQGYQKFGNVKDINSIFISNLIDRNKIDEALEKVKSTSNKTNFLPNNYLEVEYGINAADGLLQKQKNDLACQLLGDIKGIGIDKVEKKRSWLNTYCYYSKGEKEKAIDSLKKCLSFDGYDAGCLKQIILILAEQKQIDEALRYNTYYKKVDPKTADQIDKQLQKGKVE
ncbi:MAG: hypothetical protein ACD_58C00117G0002 [uncultured bacterium]|nr:MAG: hypothetical protein ACD_58C00117G0002 [uncultured bacterium]